ncbi:ribonuclease H1 domain-containing protein [Tenuifilum thalassicum]|uniref:Ribonuclease H n=1 Tax=Tenuifilum thalassicum TaxID=2590900 RepID=A0A7D4BCT4_9BACT|nr:ribonuclease H family protein [Tenuifilum thalassicum]QKG78838.1 ribonuclease H [Tenuifilum thalassicum]
MAKKNTHYVVWDGLKPGIYNSWEECQLQIKGYPNAKFKGFPNLISAKRAFEMGYEAYKNLSAEQGALLNTTENTPKPIYPSLAVDAAWNTATLEMEYQGVDCKTGKQIFHQGPFPDATNNIGEFLAIVHGLAYLKKIGSDIPIYTDSMTAISWVRAKQARTKLQPTNKNQKLFELIQRAENWLKENTWKNPLLKWETKYWGEIPADFGRK